MSVAAIFALVVPVLCLVIALASRHGGQVWIVVLALTGLLGALGVVATLDAGLWLVIPVGFEVAVVGAYLIYSQRAGQVTNQPLWLLGGALLVACLVSVVGSLTASKGSGPDSALGLTSRAGSFAPSDRPIFKCLSPSNCPGPGYAVFNSYVNAPNFGDERAFFDARLATDKPYAPGRWNWSDALQVEPGDRIVLRIYYDNDGDASAEARAGESTARGVRVAVLLARNREDHVAAGAMIKASNTHPEIVSDSVVLSSQQAINILFIPGTARIFNRAHPHGLPLDNSLFSGDGTLIGYRKMNGIIKGCFCEAGYITLEARVL